MDFRKLFEQLQASGTDADWGTLNNGLPQIQIRFKGITFFIVPDHFPGYHQREKQFICLRTFLPLRGIDIQHKDFLDAAFNRISSNIRLVKIYTVINDDILYVFFEVQALTSSELFVQYLNQYADECIHALQDVMKFVNQYPSLAVHSA